MEAYKPTVDGEHVEIARIGTIGYGGFVEHCDAIDAVHAGLERENAELRELLAVLDNRSDSMRIGSATVTITDELRKWWVRKFPVMDKKLHKNFTAIADRIDAEHEKAMSRAAQLLADAEKDRDFNYANWQDCKQKVLQHNITLDELSAEIERLEDELAHCIELPKDADGEYVHVGDVMDSRVDYLFDGKPFTVRALVLCEDGWEVADGRFGNRYEPDSLRHHHAPTVEDVLTKFGIDWEYEGNCEDRAALLAEYASKLRLAGDAE